MKIKKRKAKKTLATKATCSVKEISTVLGEKYGKVMEVMKQKKTYPAGAPFVIYHNDNMDALELEVGFPVAKEVEGEGDVFAGILPGGECAIDHHDSRRLLNSERRYFMQRHVF